MKQHVLLAGLLAAMTSVAYAAEQSAEQSAVDNKSIEEKAAPCAACHGPTGVSPSGAFPIIAGQHKSYLEKALQDYKSGARKNAVMAGQVANLSEQDIEELSAYYSKQEGPLYTPTGD